MTDKEMRSGLEGQRDDLAEELRRLGPLLQRQRRASGVRLDAGFQRALRAQLTAAPQRDDVPGPAWRTLLALLVPSRLQPALRGEAAPLVTYTAEDVTVSLATRPADGAAGGLISVYGEVDYPGSDSGERGEGTGATVEVLRGEAVVAAAALDEWGNFVLPDLPPRVYAMRLRFPDRREVIVPPARYAAEGEASLE
jgi:hypothetical protein